MDPFIVENAGNTCYMDSLLMALFYVPSNIDMMLNKDIKNTMALYLQEYIKINFVNTVRDNKSVTADMIEMLRVLCVENGWKGLNDDEYIMQQDVNEFYTFIMNLFECTLIDIQRETITNQNPNEILPFIPLSIPEGITHITIKDMLHNWLYDNGLNNNIVNIPNIIALSINRFRNNGTRINTDIIIQKKIVPTIKKMLMNNIEWIFHALICHKGETPKNGHYYSLLYNSTKWYLFDDQQIPCLMEVSMTDSNITEMIKKECVFVIYRLA